MKTARIVGHIVGRIVARVVGHILGRVVGRVVAQIVARSMGHVDALYCGIIWVPAVSTLRLG